jgi:hypothetical protein
MGIASYAVISTASIYYTWRTAPRRRIAPHADEPDYHYPTSLSEIKLPGIIYCNPLYIRLSRADGFRNYYYQVLDRL